jgi:hypothetical protein
MTICIIEDDRNKGKRHDIPEGVYDGKDQVADGGINNVMTSPRPVLSFSASHICLSVLLDYVHFVAGGDRIPWRALSPVHTYNQCRDDYPVPMVPHPPSEAHQPDPHL